MANENTNGTLAKLVALRQAFLTSIEAARSQFVDSIKTARESYLNQIVDVTMADPQLSDVEKALGNWSAPTLQPVGPPATPSLTGGMVPIGQSADASKFPLKNRRTLQPKPFCPVCGATITESDARFCSKCAALLRV